MYMGTCIPASHSSTDGNLVYELSAVTASVAILAEILLRSPRKLFVFTIKKYIDRIEVSKNK